MTLKRYVTLQAPRQERRIRDAEWGQCSPLNLTRESSNAVTFLSTKSHTKASDPIGAPSRVIPPVHGVMGTDANTPSRWWESALGP